jgi:uncharacterized protein (TIGR03435 family)
MRVLCLFFCFALPGAMIVGQAAPSPAFEVASVKQCLHPLGPDYNNQLTYSSNGFTARNATLKRLIAEAYGLQLNQVSGPRWLDQNEYDIDARTPAASTRKQMAGMLQSLLAERFNLSEHSEAREMPVYDLVIDKSGPKIHALKVGESAPPQHGFHFRGDMRQFADLLTVQFSMPAATDPSQPVRAGGPQIPVVDKTELAGTFDFSVDMRPELGTDAFTLWQRVLESQLGLRIESRKENLAILVVDSAARTPTQN